MGRTLNEVVGVLALGLVAVAVGAAVLIWQAQRITGVDGSYREYGPLSSDRAVQTPRPLGDGSLVLSGVAGYDAELGEVNEWDPSAILSQGGVLDYQHLVGADPETASIWVGSGLVVAATVSGDRTWDLDVRDLVHASAVAAVPDGGVALALCTGADSCEIRMVEVDGSTRWSIETDVRAPEGGAGAGQQRPAVLPSIVVDGGESADGARARVLDPGTGEVEQVYEADQVVNTGGGAVVAITANDGAEACELVFIGPRSPTAAELSVPCDAEALSEGRGWAGNALRQSGSYVALVDPLAGDRISGAQTAGQLLQPGHLVDLDSGATIGPDELPQEFWVTEVGALHRSGDIWSVTQANVDGQWSTRELGTAEVAPLTAAGTVVFQRGVDRWNPFLGDGTTEVEIVDPGTGATCARATYEAQDVPTVWPLPGCAALTYSDGSLAQLG